jgi:hypothetical protein
MKTHPFLPLLCSTLLILLSSVSLAAQSGGEESVVPLRDQFGVARGLDQHSGQVQIAIVVTAKKLRRLKPWERAIRENYPDLPVLRVADVPVTAPTEHEQVAEKLRKRLPEDVVVLIDLDGVWSQRYQLDVSVPNLLVFDARGELRSVHSGLYKSAAFAAFQQDLDGLLDEPPDSAQVADSQAP